MIRGAITSHIDVAQVVLYAFFVFFSGLIFYLRREDRREGYPLENEAAGRPKDRGFLLIPTPKVFRLADGTLIEAPDFTPDTRAVNATKREPWPGAPLEPNGDPMLAEVGPGSYGTRAEATAKNLHGEDLIVPTRVATNYTVASEDVSPVGFKVCGADGKAAGVVADLWVDRTESIFRYYEVELASGGGRVLLPVTFSVVDFGGKKVKVEAILESQFANVPRTRDADKVTLQEEDKITAYYGAGTLYATPLRAEPLL